MSCVISYNRNMVYKTYAGEGVFFSFFSFFLFCLLVLIRPSWSWPYGIWFYSYLCTQFLSPLKLRVFKSSSDEVYSLQHYVIKFVSDLKQVGSNLRMLKASSTNKTEILLKVVLNTIHQPQQYLIPCNVTLFNNLVIS